eukprot:12921482-Alexandrium_andersonii.AAC.1
MLSIWDCGPPPRRYGTDPSLGPAALDRNDFRTTGDLGPTNSESAGSRTALGRPDGDDPVSPRAPGQRLDPQRSEIANDL